MKYGWLRRILILLAAAAACLLMLRAGGDEPRGPVRLRLWYAESDCPAPLMEALLSRCRRDTGLRVEASSFPDEEALGAAFEEGRPDLLYGNHLHALQLHARGVLGAVAQAQPLPAGLEALGAAFLPVGARLPLLLADTAQTDADYDSFEALLDEAIVTDCVSELMYTELLAAGTRMSGVPERDERIVRYQSLYNRLALAVFRWRLLPGEDAASYVTDGLWPCAVTPSTALAGIKGESLTVLPLPLPEGADTRYPAELMGFALLGGADAEAAEQFAQWLQSLGAEAALDWGLVPMARSDAGDPLGRCLCALAESGKLTWPDADEAFYRNRAACERALREAFALLT